MGPYNKKGGKSFFAGRGRGGGGGGGQQNNQNNGQRNNNQGRGRGRGGGGVAQRGGRGGKGRGGGGGGGGQPKGADGVLVTMLKLVFEKQQEIVYDASSGMLNLANFAACPDLEGSVQKAIDFNNRVFVDALMAVVRELIGAPRFINLDNNNIKSLMFIVESAINEGIAEGINGLSAANNNISDLSFLKKMKEMSNIQEIVLEGNPVTNQADYVRQIAKRLPQLMGLDGQPLQRQPLSLPWPIPAASTDQSMELLTMLESNVFHQLESGNIDGVHSLYHSQALMTISVSHNYKLNCQPPPKSAKRLIQDLQALSKNLADVNRNHMSHNKGEIARGPTDICVLTRKLYPNAFRVLHNIDGNADVQLIEDGLKLPVAFVTIHGKMLWTHQNMAAENSRTVANFDRTFTLMNDNGWLITNDMLTLRRPKDEPLFFGSNQSRVERIGRKYGSDTAMVEAVAGVATSDLEMFGILDEISQLPQEVLEGCVGSAGGDLGNGVNTARIVARQGMSPQDAFGALQQNNFDVSSLL